MAEFGTKSASIPTISVKRKRKSTGSGADHDCSACQKRGTTCDRVRPYCGPCCIIPGQQCPGYKTVLTWGMGVASRGKLRGKTLPVPTNAVAAELPRHAPRPEDVRPQRKHKRNEADTQSQEAVEPSLSKRQRTGSYSYPYPYANLQQAMPYQPYPMDRVGWQNGSYAHGQYYGQPGLPNVPQPDQVYRQYAAEQNMHRLRTTMSFSGNMLPSPPILSPQVATRDFQPSPNDQRNQHIFSPRNHGESPDTIPISQSSRGGTFKSAGPKPILNDYNPNGSAGKDLAPHAVSTFEHLQSPVSPHTVETFARDDSNNEMDTLASPIDGTATVPDLDMLEEAVYEDEDEDEDADAEVVLAPSTTLAIGDFRSSVSMPYPGLHIRMQRVLDYYEHAICPFLVAVDGPRNPYRKHIVRLAVGCPGLQNAVAALATNNARMRKFSDAPGFGDWLRTRPRRDSELFSSGGASTAEEQYFKTRSIEALNAQLTSSDKRVASSDSVLATLLVLCLYHVCNSGHSKFRTQLSGVQKVLKLRSEESRSDFSTWVEMFFAWLDVMTSAVNDRETEIKGDCLDMTNLRTGLGDLEQFSGCDGRLFKLIARLGRLNLLSQHRPTRGLRDLTGDMTARGQSFDSMPSTSRRSQHENVQIDEQGADRAHADHHNVATPNTEFWREWQEMRDRLYEWNADTPRVAEIGDAMEIKSQSHMTQLSEAFRYSALLYVERLAQPDLPSTSREIQDLVQQSLSYIEDIGQESCITKFMLWPLFVTGTECVLEDQRDLIRARCIEIQKESGFFNNLAGLRVLERVWRDADAEAQNPFSTSKPSQTFRWRAAMDRLDGEYIVI